jgi:purine-nucleoside phosphorylase
MEKVSSMTSYPTEHTDEATSCLSRHFSTIPELALVTGSGLGGIVEEMASPNRISYADIPHFPASSVKGHAGEIVVGRMANTNLLVLSGRVHYYEGHAMQTLAFSMRVLAALGVRVVVLTNAAGGINQQFSPGDAVLIRGHLDLMRSIPLRMPETREIYDPMLRQQAEQAADDVGVILQSGVYAALSGPSYETPAEIRALSIMGADMVGMSTVPEATQAYRLGMKVLGISFITNLAAGLSQNPLSHAEVIENAAIHLPVLKKLLKQIVITLDLKDL